MLERNSRKKPLRILLKRTQNAAVLITHLLYTVSESLVYEVGRTAVVIQQGVYYK